MNDTPKAEPELPPAPWSSPWTGVGAILILLASLQFFLAMALEQALRPGYSDFGNTISDLGVNANGWSYDWIFNTSIIALGVMAITAILLLYRCFPRGLGAYLGEALIVVGCGGAIAVGIFTETYPFHAYGLSAHDYASVVTFLFANVGLTIFGVALHRHAVWDRYWIVTFLLGLGSTVALAFYIENFLTAGSFLGLGEGGLERVVAFPVLIWALLVGWASYDRWRLAGGGFRMRAHPKEEPQAPS